MEHQQKPADEKAQGGKHMMDEPDIGSGEKTPGERETEEQIKQVPQRAPADGSRPKPNH
ncbi:hypothetical protein [Pseudoduganella namucuonensis]|uniref:Uncharacterized protein n=1 Tax=Pseudoduganella namucuonensis TaxID=1035707 RepID=A0A1I7LWT8_9BURK|nr:hypothetical protein [Pseudoduganella namucuonensis]SFV14186.1 hypothetical protein SAMN05216552_104142 [Pseudoduganella namucuonensis]